MPTRTAKAQWQGGVPAGEGSVTLSSGAMDAPYGFKSRFENGAGTNPEELIAAAHAGCFTMALAFQLQTAGYTPSELSTTAAVSLEPDGAGFKIVSSTLTLVADVPGLDSGTFDKLAEAAEKTCPVSRVLNATITLEKTLK